jgi:hypothetical protein
MTRPRETSSGGCSAGFLFTNEERMEHEDHEFGRLLQRRRLAQRGYPGNQFFYTIYPNRGCEIIASERGQRGGRPLSIEPIPADKSINVTARITLPATFQGAGTGSLSIPGLKTWAGLPRPFRPPDGPTRNAARMQSCGVPSISAPLTVSPNLKNHHSAKMTVQMVLNPRRTFFCILEKNTRGCLECGIGSV